MGELCKRTEEWRVNDEAEAKALIEKAKADEAVEGYELKSYKMVKKIKSLRAKLSTNGLSSHSLNNGEGTRSNG